MMIWALIIISLTALLMSVLFVIALYAAISLKEESESFRRLAADQQERIDNMQNVVSRKFNYMLPSSLKFLEREQEELCREGK